MTLENWRYGLYDWNNTFKKYLKKTLVKCQEFYVNQEDLSTPVASDVATSEVAISSTEEAPKLILLNPRYNREVSFENIRDPLQKYLNITEDPRQLISVKQYEIQGYGQKTIIIKEPWTKYLKNLIPECYDPGLKNIKQMFYSLCNLFTSGNFLKLLIMYFEGKKSIE